MSKLKFQIEQILSLGLSQRQHQWYTDYLSNLKVVNVSPLSDVFTPEEIDRIREFVKPLPKECYRNSHLLTLFFPKEVTYVEGQVLLDIGLSIDHAWNKVRGKYVDLTFELALGEKGFHKYEYGAVGEYNLATISEVVSNTGYYGDIYRELYLQQ